MDAFVAKHLKGVSRTYAILIPMLPADLANAVGLAYLLMRIVDTLEDAPELSTEQRLHYFTCLETALRENDRAAVEAVAQPVGDLAAECELMLEAPAVLERIRQLDSVYREAAHDCACRMIAGVREFACRAAERELPYPAVRTAAELRSYCYYVAGVVGEMLCGMMAHHLKLPAVNSLREVAVELGIGLQLVNILKDALRDSRQGRRYLPTPDGAAVSHAEIYRAALQEARASLQRGTEFVLGLPAHAAALRSFCGLPIAWGAMTLTRAERDARQAKIGRGAIHSSIERFRKHASDDKALRRWFASILHGGDSARGTALAGPT
ncbi:MAG: squalene/phytoene synthase family protein [Planctomycetes bacterium]|nr:squalene/phytoene synthase family protein [Planctomycetota bacterium]